MPTFTLRPYQQECLDVIARQAPGAYLCRLATGLGKTVIFTHLPRQGRMLILSHRISIHALLAESDKCRPARF